MHTLSAGGSDYASAVSMEDAGLWPALNDALLIFPLTKSLRLALLNLLCSQQVHVCAALLQDLVYYSA